MSMDLLCLSGILGGNNSFKLLYPNLSNRMDVIESKVGNLIEQIELIHNKVKEIKDRKEFAMTLYKLNPPIPSVHFEWFGDKSESKKTIRDRVLSCETKIIYKIISRDLEENKDPSFISWIGMGSPDSTDDDIAVVVKDQYVIFDDSVLREEVGSSKELDINLITVHDGNLTWSQKGDIYETQNIIWFTYKYHPQKYPLPVNGPLEIDPVRKIRATSRYLIDFYGDLVDPHYQTQVLKKQRDLAYTETHDFRINFIKTIVPFFKPFDQIKSELKAIVLKICQIILYEEGILEYNKLLVSNKVSHPISHLIESGFQINKEEIEYDINWFLTRQKGEKSKTVDAVFRELIRIYFVISQEYDTMYQWFDIPVRIPDNHDDHNMITNCVISCLSEPTDQAVGFVCQRMGGSRGINKLFVSRSHNFELLPKGFVSEHVHLEPQRSDEWKDLLRYYSCGRNTGYREPEPGISDHEYVRHHWNLIRGNICEEIAINSLRYLGELIQVGLLVEEKRENAKGIAPDLLIKMYDDGSIMPVEIKTLTESNGHSLRRSISLARRQLLTCVRILGNLANRYCIVFVYVKDNIIRIEGSIIGLVK
jgi:hypothetical protein